MGAEKNKPKKMFSSLVKKAPPKPIENSQLANRRLLIITLQASTKEKIVTPPSAHQKVQVESLDLSSNQPMITHSKFPPGWCQNMELGLCIPNEW